MDITAANLQVPEANTALQTDQRARLRIGVGEGSATPSVNVRLSAAGVAKALAGSTTGTQSEARAREESLALNYERREKSVLRLKTQEGDLVKIALRSRADVTLEQRTVSDPDGTATEIDLGSINARRLVITVQGDLNESELAAIESAVAQARTLANDFFAGNLDAAVAAASEFGIDSEQLARVTLRFGVQERLSVSQTVALATAPTPNVGSSDVSGLDTAQALRPVAAAPAVTGAQPANALARPDAPLAPPPQSAAPAPGDAETTDAEQSENAPNLLDAFQALADLLNAFADFLNGLVAELRAPSEPESNLSNEFQIDFRFRLELFQTIVQTSLSEEPPEAVETSDFLGDVLAATAQLEDPKNLSEVA